MKKQSFDLATLDPLSLPELQGWKEKQEAVVKENPFVEVTDNTTYEEGKKRRTALVSARTSIQAQDKLIASKLKEVRSKVSEKSQELIDITLPHETKQQEEVKKYEAIKEREREEKAEKERQRVLKIRQKIDEFEAEVNKMSDAMTFQTIETTVNGAEHFLAECKSDFDFQEFEELFIESGARSMRSLNDRVAVLQEKEAQRLENERLRKESEEATRKLNLQKERFGLLGNYVSFVPDLTIDSLGEISQEHFDEIFKIASKKHAENAKKIAEENAKKAEEQAKIEADKQKIAEEKEEIRKKQEAENKMALRTKRLTDELGLKFNFQDSFVGEDGINVSVVEIKTLSDEKFDAMIQKCLDFKNRPQIEENTIEMTNGDVLPLSDEFVNNIDVIDPEMVDVNEAFPKTDEVMEVDFEETETMSNAEKAIKFLNNRSGFDDWWGMLDDETKEDILYGLQKIIG